MQLVLHLNTVRVKPSTLPGDPGRERPRDRAGIVRGSDQATQDSGLNRISGLHRDAQAGLHARPHDGRGLGMAMDIGLIR
jgi:hypothetical protein